ncbi:MAG: SLBB domain-containing protein [Bacteroidales bacterium]|nr:SLBB domain-containing protein [Bacteroidales bacterium]
MKLNKLLILCALMLMPLTATANMTDQQIMKYVAEQQALGTSQQEMIQYLVKRGVTPQQIQTLKQKLSKMKASGDMPDKTVTNGRMRTAQNPGSKNSDVLQQEYVQPVADSVYVKPVAEEKTIKVFGRDIFRNENVSFEPNMNIATPGNYILGAGDQVFIDVYGASQMTIDGTISPDGKITVENVGPVQLGGLTVEQATKRLRSKLGRVYADSKISLTVGQTRTIQVNVMGEVQVPGSYTLSAFATVFHALYSAGGVSEIGSLRNIRLYRNNQLVTTADMYDYILNGQLSGDIRLEDNDVIVVGTYEALVNISGKVKRPMFYEMKPDETVGKALEYAGGFASGAYTKTLRVFRKSGSDYQVLNVSESNKDQLLVADGDSVSIDSISMRYKNMVELRGAVFHEGMYQLSDETHSVAALLAFADGVAEDAYTERAVIQRMRKDRTLETVRIDLQGILDGSSADVELQNEDVLIIPSLQSAHESQTLTLYGDVMEPGVYAFSHNTTVSDFILQSGGLTDKAMDGELSITVAHRDGTSQTLNLDDPLVLKPYDQVYVHSRNQDLIGGTVCVEGEVQYEGSYTLTGKTSHISDIISLAGGLTGKAAPNGVYVLRLMNEQELRMRQLGLDYERYRSTYNAILRSTQIQGVTTLPISDSLLIERYNREDIYKVAVDIRQALKHPGSKYDLLLRDGDRIIVEEEKNVVKLTGSVAYSVHVPYVEGKRVGYYLRQGGLPAKRGNVKRSYIIDQNGRAWSAKRFTKVPSGSEVVLRERTSEMSPTQKTSIFVSVASAVTTAAAIVISVLK